MKKTLTLTLILILVTNAQSSNLLVTVSQPNPDATGICTGLVCNLGEVIYPMTIDIQNCTTTFGLDLPASAIGITSGAFDYSNGNCLARTQYFVLDGIAYELLDLPFEDEEVYIEFGTAADIVWIKQELFNCHTLSGDPFDVISNNPPVLIGNSLIFNMSQIYGIKTIYTDPSYIAYELNSTNGDIVCDNGIILPAIDGTVFKNGFE